ncbi:MAG: protein-L-isoaspartate(D-aspartate) O-methyltransferase [Lentisphaeria bacterium]|nr:protein-L-isoaspartate(D-aspartate) O-methyltransferase [Candidatus Neomarinimicrobiota bacterium]MCF7842096.1 protein-L-isoaspartate(D-aspartate) O-methyltransferase [Lentisphaeria bacterium]
MLMGIKAMDENRERRGEISRMIETQLKRRGIRKPEVLEVFQRIPRHLFVPGRHQVEAYGDFPLPIGSGQTISQPFVIALMLEYLNLEPHHHVLEVGTGSGYATALLSSMVAWVDSVEFYQSLLDEVDARLEQVQITNCALFHGNGWEGPPAKKLYDRIVVWASPNQVPENLVRALKPDGRMVVPVGKGDQRLYIITQSAGKVQKEFVDWVRFVPLINGDPL